MNKLKFSKDEGSDFYKELKVATANYFSEKGIERTGGRKMLFKIGFYIGLFLLFYLLMINADSLAAFYICYLLMGLSVLFTAFNISHDAAHGVAVKSKRWNQFLFSFSFNLQGNNAYVWGKNHNESHHLYTNVEGSDIDVLNNPLFRMTGTQPLKWYHRYQFLYAPVLYLLYSINWFLFGETLMIFNISSRTIKIAIPPKEVMNLIVFKLLYLGYMIVLPILLLPFGWGHVLLAFLINHFIVSILFVGVLGVSHVSDYVHHPEPDENNQLAISWPKLQMITSVDYNPGSRFFNFTLGGFNAHALHHLLPDISHVHYLEILPIFRRLAKKHGIVYMEMPYHEALAAHFRFLKTMGRQQEIVPKRYPVKRWLTAASVSLLLIVGKAEAQKMRKVFPVGTYNQDSIMINGVSAGGMTNLNIRSNTNGIKLELIGSGMDIVMMNFTPVSENPIEHAERTHNAPLSYVNGASISLLGTICDCVTNGISVGYVAQLNRTINGVSASGLMNYVELHNGIQIAALFANSYRSNGLQIGTFTKADRANGFQIGGANYSRETNGIQIGLINMSERMRGLQIGIWNVNGRRKFPLINF